MSGYKGSSFVLRAIVVNAFLVVGFVQAQRTGKLTGTIIAIYVGMAILANSLMYFASRARRRMQNR